MGYRFAVTNLVRERSLSHLGTAENKLSAVLSRPRTIALACIATLTALGWLSLGLISADGGPDWQVLCRPGAAMDDVVLLAPMWAAMTLAMMLPTAAPMILTYAEIADTAAQKREPVVSPLVLTAGYVAVWLGFAMAAASLQWALAHAEVSVGGRTGGLLTGTLLLGAGAYQFSALKQACLSVCQRPFPFFFANWTTEPVGVFRLGLRQGIACVGCCWAAMSLMFVFGFMNVVWMAALGVLMTIEKLSTTARFSRVVGVVFVLLGLGMLASSSLL